jgi:hypothetical protein
MKDLYTNLIFFELTVLNSFLRVGAEDRIKIIPITHAGKIGTDGRIFDRAFMVGRFFSHIPRTGILFPGNRITRT